MIFEITRETGLYTFYILPFILFVTRISLASETYGFSGSDILVSSSLQSAAFFFPVFDETPGDFFGPPLLPNITYVPT